ncbi:glycosyltransferase family 87 protein [Parabacteroides provencensis]|uniref:glycosyltransferase family 87 protein n=1 Tax=Parabacteroides provencensis TaxID=1944636 RepID=UPI000C1555F2|nr:glycosyltransferase family 87 protein [Parabacteroides provencensis]
MNKLRSWINHPVLRQESTLFWIWTASAVLFAAAKLLIGKYNNYKIFENVFHHAVNGLPLYLEYPAEYYDVNHYGPFFSLVIAPFTLLPDWLGMVFWIVANTMFLFYAIRQLPLTHNQRIFIYWYSLCELMTAQGMQQYNISVAAFIILAYAFIKQKKDFWAACAIMFGAFIKIYPIAGLAFFFFSRHKTKFILSCFFWAALFLTIPMLYAPGPDYILSQYIQWFERLGVKNELNMFAKSQNISLLGIVRKLSGNASYSDLCLIIPGLVLFFIPYLRISQYKHLNFQLMLLANVLLFVVLFSTGSEASGYISAMIGVALWYLASPSPHRTYNRWLMIATLIIVGLSTTELVPPFIRHNFIVPYVIKAWPCTVVWLTIGYEMICLDFSAKRS